MRTMMLELAAYHHWANEKLFACIAAQPEELLHQALPGSFPSIYSTLLHVWDAEAGWWQRIKLQEVTTLPSSYFKGSAKDIMDTVLQQNKAWEQFIRQSAPYALEHVCQYYTNKRELFKQPVSQIIFHVFNHGTYHRGQLVTQLRQAGVTKIPGTDFILYARKGRS